MEERRGHSASGIIHSAKSGSAKYEIQPGSPPTISMTCHIRKERQSKAAQGD